MYNENEIISCYLSEPISIVEISNKFGLSTPTMSKILKRNNIDLYARYEYIDKYVNSTFFSQIDSEYKAYFLGLLIADGCIYNNTSSKKLIIQLKQSDRYILEYLKYLLNTGSSLVVDPRDNSSSLAVTNTKICEDLIALGFDERGKPYRYINFNLIDPNLHRHIIRGIFDGDGCVTIRNINQKNLRCIVGFCGYYHLLADIKIILETDIGPTNNAINKENNIFSLKYYAIDNLISIYNYLYLNSSVCMLRKKNKMEEFFKNKI